MHQSRQSPGAMYTQIPDAYQQQYVNVPSNIAQNLTPGVIPSRYTSSNGMEVPQQNYMSSHNFEPA